VDGASRVAGYTDKMRYRTELENTACLNVSMLRMARLTTNEWLHHMAWESQEALRLGSPHRSLQARRSLLDESDSGNDALLHGLLLLGLLLGVLGNFLGRVALA